MSQPRRRTTEGTPRGTAAQRLAPPAGARTPPPDRTVPASYAGSLAPGYLCRAWNPTRQKYCRQRAGAGTDHRGTGRCRVHDGGGAKRVKHGQLRRYADVTSLRYRDLIAKHQDDPNPLDILPELAAARSLFQDFVERYDPWREALLAWHASFGEPYKAARRQWIEDHGRPCVVCDGRGYEGEVPAPNPYDYVERPRQVLDIGDAHRIVDTITRIVERIEKIRAENAISFPELERLTAAMLRSVKLRVTDEATVARIQEDWLGLLV